MLVSVSGPQGAGKSTLINAFIDQFPHVNTINRKTSRSVLEEMDITLEDVYESSDLQKKFQLQLLRRKYQDELDAVVDDVLWITERSYADLFAYSVAYLGKHNANDNWINAYYEECAEYQHTYCKVIYLPGGKFDINDDGVRPINNHYGRMIDKFTRDSAIIMNADIVSSIDDLDINIRTTEMVSILTDVIKL
jgi:GTPase SAR1 family protein